MTNSTRNGSLPNATRPVRASPWHPAIFRRIAGKPWWGTKGECSGWIVNSSGWATLEFGNVLGIRNVIANPVSENVGTFVLVFAVLFLVISVYGLGVLYALLVGLLVLAIG